MLRNHNIYTTVTEQKGVVMPSYMIVTLTSPQPECTKVALVETQPLTACAESKTDRACFLKNLSHQTDSEKNKKVIAEGRTFIINDTSGKYISSVTLSEIREASLLLCFDSGNLLAEELSRDVGRWDSYAIYQLVYDNLKEAKIKAKKLKDISELLDPKSKNEVKTVPSGWVNELGMGLLLAGEELVVQSCNRRGKPSTRSEVITLKLSVEDTRSRNSCCS